MALAIYYRATQILLRRRERGAILMPQIENWIRKVCFCFCWEGLQVFCRLNEFREVSEGIWDSFVEVKIVWRNLINIDVNTFEILFLETFVFRSVWSRFDFRWIANFLEQSIFFFVINRRILDSISFFYSFLFYAIEYIKSNTEKCIIWKQTG